MAITQQEFSNQIIAQLRLLDPSVSAEVGSPERKIIDVFAESLADSQIDLVGLQGAFDLDSKFGLSLDRYLAIFGYARQKATFATGFVTLSRVVPATADIRIPGGTQLLAPVDAVAAFEGDILGASEVTFYTTLDVTLPAGDTVVVAPIRCNLGGTIGNVAAGRITQQIGAPILGITSVFNELPTAGGRDQETDDEFKVRFRNTIFRNLAGTKDQFLALAVSTAVTTKANIIGPQNVYREYIQIPPVDDASSYDIDDDGSLEDGQGNAGEYTTALSTIPFAKSIYSSLPVYISNGQSGVDLVFYRQDVDFRFNITTNERNVGDAARESAVGITDSPANTIAPNITFTNVYTGLDETVKAPRAGDVVLLEYKYVSEASRNDLDLNVTNSVDMFIDGGNDTFASTVTFRPTIISSFVDNPSSKYHYENFRRIGHGFKRPHIGNVLMAVFWQPISDLPEQIIVNENTYYKDIHYWAVQDISNIGGTVRSRDGIEWSMDVKGQIGVDADIGPYTGLYITEHPSTMPIDIDNYIYDRNIVDLQAIIENNKQITTDVLVHKAKRRFFKLDITVMYSGGSSVADTNLRIREAVDRFFKEQNFGSTIQLSDLLFIIHGVTGVDNVRWSTDIVGSPDLVRILETDIDGRPLLNVEIDRYQTGNVTRAEIQTLYITGEPESGGYTLSFNGNTTGLIAYNATASAIQTALNAAPVNANVTVIEDVRSAVARNAIRSLGIFFNTNGAQSLINPDATGLGGGPTVVSNDFILRDDELAGLPTQQYFPPTGTGDNVAGLIIRARAQNTWQRGR